MSKQQPIEIFMPPNMLKAKVGGRITGLDMAAIKRGEEALVNLKTEFENWISADTARLSAARDAYSAERGEETHNSLFRASHDFRSQALTFGYPLAARVAESLCKLLDGGGSAVPVTLVDAHVDAIRIIVRQEIRHTEDKTTHALVSELDARVSEYLEKPESKD